MKPIEISHSKGWSTHNTLLIKAVLFSTGPVCEVGAGLFSTPLLHWLCKAMGRELRTYEHDEEFFLFAKKFQSYLHRIRKIDNWDDMEFSRHWGVVLIDHVNERRAQDAIGFKDTADYIVLHDTDKKYKYGDGKIWPNFKYRFDDIEATPNTSVVSNFYKLDKFNEKLTYLHKP